jgi:hypothetical protein
MRENGHRGAIRAAAILALLICLLIISPCFAEEYYIDSYTIDGTVYGSVESGSKLRIAEAYYFVDLHYIEVDVPDKFSPSSSGWSDGEYHDLVVRKTGSSGTIVANGTVWMYDTDDGWKMAMEFDDWDLGGSTGHLDLFCYYLDGGTQYSVPLDAKQVSPGYTAYTKPITFIASVSSVAIGGDYYFWGGIAPTPTPTPTPTPYPGTISVNLLEKYSNAALINQAITLTPTSGGAGETKTSLYGETLHFGVVPGIEYWFNASRSGYADYNETYTIPASPGIYTAYMERTLTPIANHSYAHFSVVDQTNGGLIPNAEIRLSDGQTKLTNSAGYAWFSVNNSEQINYYVSKPSGYWPAYGAMNLTADESILVALQRYTGPTATATMPGWTPVTVPTTGTGVDPVVTLSAQLRQQNVQEGMDVWYTNLPFISQFLFLLFIIGGLGLMAGGTRRN